MTRSNLRTPDDSGERCVRAGLSFLEALRTGRPLRRQSWWRHFPEGPGDRWLVLDPDGTWHWTDGSDANPPLRGEYLCDDWEIAPP